MGSASKSTVDPFFSLSAHVLFGLSDQEQKRSRAGNTLCDSVAIVIHSIVCFGNNSKRKKKGGGKTWLIYTFLYKYD